MIKENKDLLIQGIELYSGRQVTELQVHPDPKVYGAYAVRCLLGEEKEQAEFLAPPGWNARDASHVSESIEECSFRSWPPNSGKLRFV